MVKKGQPTAAGTETRSAILEAALRLLGMKGPDNFSAAALAREAGVSKATIFHHFSSIDRIPIAALERLWSQWLTAEIDQPTSARQYLLGLGQRLIDMASHDRDLLNAQMVFVTRAIFDPEMHERISQGAQSMHKLVVKALRARLPEQVPPEEIDRKARLVEMTLDGLMLSLVTRTKAAQRGAAVKTWQRSVDLILEGAE